MRAVAILAVVLFHAHVGLLRGGYTGVDDFYVISGFLITGILWREVESSGRLSFRGFYSRRIQRLLPMSFLVLFVTAVASARWLPPLQARATLKDGIASALYVANYRFAFLQTNYLTSSAPPSPFQHYWSLGVEEQFYLIWPLVLLGAALMWRRQRTSQPSRPFAISALALIAIGSFVLCVWLTNVAQPWAFFSLGSRAWELAIGGLVAFAAPSLARADRQLAAVLGWAGLAVVIGAALILSTSTPYPGVAALAPVLGTAAVIASGCARPQRGPVMVLGTVGMQVIGRISYSWYLWHWPVLILVPYAVGHALSLAQNLGLAAGSGLLAVVSFVLIEHPIRRLQWLRARPWRDLRLAGGLAAAGVGVCLVAMVTLPALVGHGTAPQALIRGAGSVAEVSANRHGVGQGSGTQKGAATSIRGSTPDAVQLASANAQIQEQIARSVRVQDVPANLRPSLANAEGDEPDVFVDGCMDEFLASNVLPCQFADTSSSTSVVLFGDSHAAMWFPAVDGAANALGWKVINWTKATCPPLSIDVFSVELGRAFTECMEWRQSVLGEIAQLRPSLVILGVARHYSTEYGFTVYGPEWLHGLSTMVRTISAMGPKVVVIGPIPKPPFDVPGCLSVHLTSATACTVARAEGIDESGKDAEAAAVRSAGGFYLDPQSWFCSGATCAVIVDNLLVYRDDNHITATYSSYLSSPMEAELALAARSR